MTTYEQLAADMLAEGLKPASVSAARHLAERSMYGETLTETEQRAIETWLARPWIPEPRKKDA